MTTERRQFNRVTFNTSATLLADGHFLDCQLVDISLKGVLVTLLTDRNLDPNGRFQLEIPLSEDGDHISMRLALAHQEDLQLGLECVEIDLDSITHLRRLIELNLGDDGLLERDFEALCSDNQ